MQHIVKSIVLILLALTVSPTTAYSKTISNDDVPELVSSALAGGNAKEVAQYFNSSIQLIVLDTEGMYNRSQAEQILKMFFTQHTPTQFILKHEGGTQKKDSRFIIGTLQTKKGVFRVSLFMKVIDGSMSIHQFRIEEDNA